MIVQLLMKLVLLMILVLLMKLVLLLLLLQLLLLLLLAATHIVLMVLLLLLLPFASSATHITHSKDIKEMTSETINTFKSELEKQMLKDYVFERNILTQTLIVYYKAYILWLRPVWSHLNFQQKTKLKVDYYQHMVTIGIGIILGLMFLVMFMKICQCRK